MHLYLLANTSFKKNNRMDGGTYNMVDNLFKFSMDDVSGSSHI